MKPLEIWFMDVKWINMDSGQGPGVQSCEQGTVNKFNVRQGISS